jgi:DNA-binding CsgD family transcriptional regulator
VKHRVRPGCTRRGRARRGYDSGNWQSPIRPTLERLPLIARTGDLQALRAAYGRALAGGSAGRFISGAPGVGKSRLLMAIGEEASLSCTVITCRAFPIGSSVPYALFSDGFVPALRAMDKESLTVLARGHEGRLARLFPAAGPAPTEDAADQTQLFWTFAEFLRAWSERRPLVLLFDDVHWADAASLELLHFLCRQLREEPVAFLGTINDAERDAHPTLKTVLRSLESLTHVDQQPLEPLGEQAVADLINHVFGVDETATSRFTRALYRWTRGNPFFVRETLGELVASGRLRQEAGSWIGWETDDLSLPRSIREAIELQLERLAPDALTLAETCAIIGGGAELRSLRAVSELDEATIVRAVELLRHSGMLVEDGPPDRPRYDFRHPMLRQVLEQRIGLARRQYLHERVATALEAQYGDEAPEHAEELAHHWVRARDGQADPTTIRYLIAAGERSLARFADREAETYLSAALEQLDRFAPGELEKAGGRETVFRVLRRLASARQRAGKYAQAAQLRERAYRDYLEMGQDAEAAATVRRIGLAHFWAGRPVEALEALGRALAHALVADEQSLIATVRLAMGGCLQALGRVAEAREEFEAALRSAERSGDDAVEARVRRALLIFHTMSGPPELAREHGVRALEIARARADAASMGGCHWALAVLEGLTGQGRLCADHIARGSRIADEINDPRLRLALDEVAIEWAFSSGDWDTGLALGERAIALARSLNQRLLLPRLLVWTSLIYLGRQATDRAKSYLDEAWELSGADDPAGAPDLHSVIAVHTGFANYHRTIGAYDEAIRVGRRGLALAHAVGFTAWGVHRLLPTVIEAHFYKDDPESAEAERERLRADAEALGHTLGLAWSDAGDAIVEWLRGDAETAVRLLRAAAERLEAVPFVWDAARVRRQLAARLVDVGDRDGAISELRAVHDVFVRLGAGFELEKTREQLRELGARPPVRSAGQGTRALTDREHDIVRLVASGASNKAIAKELGISPRTVTTHLSNVYRKLEINSRGELAEMAPAFLTASGQTGSATA